MTWHFTVTGNPLASNYFIVSTGQAASIRAGDKFTDTSNLVSYIFTVTMINPPFAGFNNIVFWPPAPVTMNGPDVVTQIHPPVTQPAAVLH